MHNTSRKTRVKQFGQLGGSLAMGLLLGLTGCKHPTDSFTSTFTGSTSEKFPAVAAPINPKVGLQAPADKYEQDFPYQIACIESATNNIVNKGVALKLGNNASLCFDTDLLRVSAGWTGKYLRLSGVSFDGGHGGHPMVAGEVKFSTKNQPGWADASGSFADTRPEPYGPVSEKNARYDGLYVHGDYVVFAYTVLGTKIQEQPSSVSRDGVTGFVRTFRVGKTKANLAMAVCDVDGTGSVENGVVTVNGPKDSVTKVSLGNAPKGAALALDGGRVVMKLAQGAAPSVFKVVVWQGGKAEAAKFAGLVEGAPTFVEVAKGGPARWPEVVTTKGVLNSSSTPDGAYVTDVLTAPENNPWKRRVRFSGLDFFSDGKRAALSTWDGDVWVVSGIDDKLENLSWKRFASGGFENHGLKIVKDQIYITGRDQVTRFYDYNGDGEADYYENFNNQVTSSPGFHEFPFDLQTDSEGNFYTAKAGPVKGGGRGFGGGGGNGVISRDAGTLMKISKDGKTRETFATGFRAPNGMGIGPNNEITTGDNEGTWQPACPLNWVVKDGFYGVEDLAHKSPIPPYNKPLMWFSKGWDNSGGGQIWATTDKMGPIKGELLHCSYGTSSLYLIMKDKVGDQMQGGAVKIPVKFTSSAMRPRINPKDGQIYVAGLKGWQSNATRETGLDRIRYTGKTFYSANKLKVTKEGIQLSFSQPLDPSSVNDLQNYSGKRWDYLRSVAYGSDDYLPGTNKKGQESVDFTGVKLSPDGKTLTLAVADLKPVNQFLIKYNLKAKDGTAINQEVLQTIHIVQ